MNDSYQDPSSGFYSSGTDNSHQRQESGPGGAPVMDNPYAREKMALTALILAVAAIITFQVFFVSMPARNSRSRLNPVPVLLPARRIPHFPRILRT